MVCCNILCAREYQQHRIWDIVCAFAELMTTSGESRFAKNSIATVLFHFATIEAGKFRAAERCR